jgi:transcriptional regulator with XRE-family HTH domain
VSAVKSESGRRPSLLRVRLRLRGLQTALGKVTAQVQALGEAIEDLSPLVEVIAYLDTSRKRPSVSFPLLRRHARFVREQEGLSRARLGALVGVSAATIRNFETGKNRPQALTEARLLQVLAERAQSGRYAPVIVETLLLACELTAAERKTERPACDPYLHNATASPIAQSIEDRNEEGTSHDPSPQAHHTRPQLGTPYVAEVAQSGRPHTGRARRARQYRPRHPARD